MKLVILYSIVVLCISDYVNAQCNLCLPTAKVACFSTTKYFKCNAASEIDTSQLFTCAVGVCSDTANACSGIAPTCPEVVVSNIAAVAPGPVTTTTMNPLTTTTMSPLTTTTMNPLTTTTMTPLTTTTVATITSAGATAWCQNKAAGRYAQPGDKTCTNYVYCYLNGGIMGWVYSCSGTTLFNPMAGYCQAGHVCV
ncbi:unnamed protein product [Diamesa tonsa]